MKIIDGLALNKKIQKKLKSRITKSKGVPHLAIVQVGNDPASSIFIRMKIRFAEKIGAEVSLYKFPIKISEKKLIDEVKKINGNKKVHGIIVQMPLPKNIDFANVINVVDQKKDVDGLGKDNLTELFREDKNAIVPATARGIATLLKENKISIEGKNIVVIGRSVLVGKTTAMNLLNRDATITICHKKTKNLDKIAKSADILIVATGVPGLIKKIHTHSRQIIIDVGISKLEDKMVGDVAHNVCVAMKTPVPGGVGPMTVASLFENLFDTFSKQV